MREDSQAVPAHPLSMAAFDPARVLRASSLKLGDFRARGVPAILLGVSAIVAVAGAARALRAAAPALPEVLRETKNLVDAVRRDQPRLSP
jgi:hypothetical protein